MKAVDFSMTPISKKGQFVSSGISIKLERRKLFHFNQVGKKIESKKCMVCMTTWEKKIRMA